MVSNDELWKVVVFLALPSVMRDWSGCKCYADDSPGGILHQLAHANDFRLDWLFSSKRLRSFDIEGWHQSPSASESYQHAVAICRFVIAGFCFGLLLPAGCIESLTCYAQGSYRDPWLMTFILRVAWFPSGERFRFCWNTLATCWAISSVVYKFTRLVLSESCGSLWVA